MAQLMFSRNQIDAAKKCWTVPYYLIENSFDLSKNYFLTMNLSNAVILVALVAKFGCTDVAKKQLEINYFDLLLNKGAEIAFSEPSPLSVRAGHYSTACLQLVSARAAFQAQEQTFNV